LLRFEALNKVAESLAEPPLTSGALDPPQAASKPAAANSAVNPFALMYMSAPRSKGKRAARSPGCLTRSPSGPASARSTRREGTDSASARQYHLGLTSLPPARGGLPKRERFELPTFGSVVLEGDTMGGRRRRPPRALLAG